MVSSVWCGARGEIASPGCRSCSDCFWSPIWVGVAGVLLLPQIDAGFLNSGKPYLDFVFPERPEDSRANWTPLRTIGEQIGMIFGGDPNGIINLLVNCCLFVPFPVLLGLCFPQLKCRYRFLIPFAAILVCEAVQPFCGRSVDIEDVILNTAGTLVGVLISILIDRLWTRKQKTKHT